MNRMIWKKTVAFVLTFVMIMSTVPSAIFAATPGDFVDFPTGWSKEAVTAAVNNGLLNGRTSDTIVPGGNLTRAEMATIINRAFGAVVEADISNYTDVPIGEWYYHEIAKAVNMQTFQGDSADIMRPNDSITREEVFAVIARALVLESSDYSSLNEFNDAYMVSEWAKPYASILVAKDYVNGDDLKNLNPLANITREEFAQIMHNIIKTYYVSEGVYNTAGPDSTLIRSGNVTLKDVIIDGDLILGDGVGTGDVTLNNVTIKGRLLARGGEGKVTLIHTTVGEHVVVKDVNGTVNFNNYRTDSPFAGIREITPATFLPEQVTISPSGGTGGSGGSGGGSVEPKKYSYTIYHYVEDPDGTVNENGINYRQYDQKTGSVEKGKKITLTALNIPGYYLDTASGDADKADTQITINSATTLKLYYRANQYVVNITLPDGSTQNITYKHGETFGSRFNMAAYPNVKFYYLATDGSTEVEVSESLPVTSSFNVLSKAGHKVVFDFNDGLGTTQEVIVYNGETVGNKIPEPQREGYDLAGWNTMPDGSGQVFTSASTVNTPISVYALWNKIPYTITYESQFEFNPSAVITYSYDIETAVTLPVEADFADHSGYRFDGWYTEKDPYINKITSIEAGSTGDVVLYARWLDVSVTYHNVIFDYNYPGSVPAVVPVAENESVTRPTDPVRTGYTFGGWYTTNTLEQVFDFSQGITSETTIYAKWTIDKYPITYDLNGGSFKADAYKPVEYTVEMLPLALPGIDDVAYIGNNFVGWYKDSQCTLPVSQIPAGTTGEFKVYAKWQPKTYTVIIKTPGEADQTKTFVHGQTIGDVIPNDPARTGYTFTGYNTSTDGSGTSYNKTDAITESVTLYTQWTAIEYNISYELNGATMANASAFDNKYTIEESVTLPSEADFVPRAGYTFGGWYKNRDFSGTEITQIPLGSINDVTLYAKWNEINYSITYELYDGIIKNSDKFVSEYSVTKSVTLPVAADFETRNGYVFAGWYQNGEFTGNKVTVIPVNSTGNKTFHAKWDKQTYTINYTLNGGTKKNTSAFVTSYTITDSFTLPVESDFNEREGYDFIGWYKNSSFTGYPVTVIPAGTTGIINLYAKWEKKTYNVTFNVDGVTTSKTYTHGDKISSLMTDPSKSGYTFAGWYTGQNGTGTAYTKDSEVKGAYVLYAHWSTDTYPIVYNLNGGTKLNESAFVTSYNIETAVTLPTAADFEAREGWTFIGWYKDASFATSPVTEIPVNTTGPVNLYARWEKNTYSVSFNVDGVITSKNYIHGDKISSQMVVPSKDGFEFTGWNTNEDGSGTNYQNDDTVTASAALYAQFKAVKYTITYVLGDGYSFKAGYTAPSEFYVTSEDILLPTAENISEDDTHEFYGWYLDGALITKVEKGTFKNITVYAKWNEKAKVYYDVIFNYNYANAPQGGEYSKIAVEHNTVIGTQKPADPIRSGYSFGGWYADSACNNAFNFETKISAITTIYAKWTKDSYTIEYDLGGASKANEAAFITSYDVEDEVILPAENDFVSRPGYEFKGWYGNSGFSGGQIVSIPTGTTGNKKFYAKWDKLTYTISYEVDGASIKNSDAFVTSYTVTDSVTLPLVTDFEEREAYNFLGWYDNRNFEGTAITSIPAGSTEPKVFWARWEKKTYTVTFVVDGVSTPVTYDYGELLASKMPDPSKEAYTFDKWNTSETGVGISYSSNTPIMQSVTLYACWTPIEYEIDYVLNEGTMKNAAAFVSSYNIEETVTLPVESDFEENEAYKFLGWYDNSNFDGDAITSIPVGTAGNKEYWAKWEIKTYEVVFSVDGATTQRTYTHGETVGSKMYEPEKNGYTFAGWNTDVNGLGLSYKSDSQVKQALTLYAQWTADNYQITYNLNGAQIQNASAFVESYNIATAVTLPVASDFVNREEYKFLGWYDNASFTGAAVTVIPTGVTGDKEYWARWEKNTYDVIFNIDGTETTKTYTHGDAISTQMTAPSKDGYEFTGWNTNEDGSGTNYQSDAEITASLTLYAQYKAIQYKITYARGMNPQTNTPFEFKDGYTPVYEYYVTSDDIVLPVASDFKEYESYEFYGWYKNPGYNGELITVIEKGSSDDITLYAKWIEKAKVYHDVIFSYNYDGAPQGGEYSKIAVESGKLIANQKPNDPTRSGYEFGGWYKDAACAETFKFTDAITADTTIYAKWDIIPYSIIYYNISDVAINNQDAFVSEYNAETAVTLPVESDFAERPGYEFDGWYDNDKFDGAKITSITAGSTGDKEFYAKWNKLEYTITYNIGDGTIGTASAFVPVYTVTDEITLPVASDFVTREDYTFAGWYDNAEYENEPVLAINLGTTGSKAYWAKWKKNTYDVIFSVDGVEESHNFEHGQTVSDKVSNPAKTGYTFENWNTSEDATGTIYTRDTPVKEETTLYAIWKANEYTVKYDGNGATEGSMENTAFVYDTELALSKNTYVRTGYSFLGWSQSPDAVTASYTDEQTVKNLTSEAGKEVVLYAVWQVKTYKLVFDVNGGIELTDADLPDGYVIEDGKATIEVSYGSIYPELPVAKHSDNKLFFGGWFIDGNAITQGLTVGELTNTAVTAKWSDKLIHTVVFDSYNSDGTPKLDEVINGEKITKPSDPQKEGHSFAGWYADSNFETEFDFSQVIDYTSLQTITVYIKWDVNLYTVSFDTDGGTSIETQSVSYGEKIIKPADPEKENYDFAGWYLDGVEYDFTLPVKSALTLVARWKAKATQNYVVTFYEGAIEDDSMYISEKEVAAGTSMTQDDIDDAMSVILPYDYPEEGHTDGSYTHYIYPDLWYIADDGEWKPFDDTVVINADMNVFYAFRSLSLYFDLEIGEFKMAQPVSFSVPYQRDSRIINSVKDAMTLARNEIDLALNKDDIYVKAIEQASEKSGDLIDANGNIKYAEVDTAISNIIKSNEIDGEIAEYIEDIIVNNNDDEKLNSAILLLCDNELIKDEVLGGAEYDFATVKSYIDGLSVEERVEFADKVHDLLAVEQYYIDFIDGFEKGHDHFTVTHENINFVMAVATAVNEYTYEELKDRIYAKFGKIIDVIGDDVAKEFMTDAQTGYYDGAHILWDEMMANKDDMSYRASYPSYLTFRLNVIDHLFRPVYDEYRIKAIDRFTEDNIYYYAQNTYLQQLVDMDADTVINDLFYTVPKTDENIGYALWPSVSGESGFLHYYDYIYEKLLLFDKAMLWYEENLSADELEAFKTKVFCDIARALNKANETIDGYEADGSLILGKNISDLMEIEQFAKLFNRFEDKIVSGLQKYKSTQFYGKTWDAESVRNTEFAEDAANAALGIDDPVFNIDSLLDMDIVNKAFDKAGFTDFTDSFDQDMGYTVTTQSIERIFRGNHIVLRRFYW